MKSSAPRVKPGPSPQGSTATGRRAQPNSSGPTGARRAPRCRYEPVSQWRGLTSSLPDSLPVLPEEVDLVRNYFADLVADMLKNGT